MTGVFVDSRPCRQISFDVRTYEYIFQFQAFFIQSVNG